MNRKEMIEKNLELHYHLMMQLLRDPDSLEIPDDAEAVFLPQDDDELREPTCGWGEAARSLASASSTLASSWCRRPAPY